MKDINLILAGLIIILIMIFTLGMMYQDRNKCNHIGGNFVRTELWFICIK
jgi:hypothetical protein